MALIHVPHDPEIADPDCDACHDEVYDGEDLEDEEHDACPGCGCTDDQSCRLEGGEACSWTPSGFCSGCDGLDVGDEA